VASRQDIPANRADIRAGVRSAGLDALFTDGVIFVGWLPQAIHGWYSLAQLIRRLVPAFDPSRMANHGH